MATWLPEQTACALEELASDMRALIAKTQRIERSAGPAAFALIRASDPFTNMPLHDFADDAETIAKALFAAIEAKEPA